jgi:hypothetical protein
MIGVKEVLAGDISVKESLAGEINNGVKVISPSLTDLEVTPSKDVQTFKHEGSYGYDNVTINPIPDEYIVPSLEAKVITPTKEVQTVLADEGYDGLNQVTVNAIPDEYIVPSGEMEITENGIYDVTSVSTANVNVAGGGSEDAGLPLFMGISKSFDLSSAASWEASNDELLVLGYTRTDMCLIVAMVRSDFTLSDNMTLVAETDWFTGSGTQQKTIVALADISDSTKSCKITQASSGRMVGAVCHFMKANEPVVILNEIKNNASKFEVATEDYFNLYVASKIISTQGYYFSEEFDFYRYITRLIICWSCDASDSRTINIDSGNGVFGVIGLRIPYKK